MAARSSSSSTPIPGARRAIPIASAALVLLLVAGSAGAGAPSRTHVRVHLDADARRLDGRVTFTLVNHSDAGIRRAYLWLYPNRLATPAPALDDVNFYWVYPRQFDPGGMTIEGVTVAGRPARAEREVHAAAGASTLWSVALDDVLSPGQRVELAVDFRARIPARYGGFGCTDETCVLAGGFHPMLATLDAAGWDLLTGPAVTDMVVELTLAAPAHVILGDRVSPGPVARVAERLGPQTHATLLVAPRWHRSERRVGARELVHLSTTPPPPADTAQGQILPYTQEDFGAFALDATAAALDALAHSHVDPGAGRVTLVEVPLRFSLAESHPQVVLVSDRFYRIWPADRFRALHARQLVRAVYQHWAARLLTGREAPRELEVASGVVAAYLTERFAARARGGDEQLDDMLAPVSFIPVVDQLLYAPQTMFAGAYFGGVDGGELARDDVRRFMHQRPDGQLVYAKLRALLAPEALAGAMAAVLRAGEQARRALERAHGGALDWFFRQWALPHPRLDYRLVSRTSAPDGDGYVHVIVVERAVAAGDEAPVEPVVVLAVDEAGTQQRLRWDGRGARGVLRFRSSAPLAEVVVDPDGQLLEELWRDGEHPRFDNRDRHDVRFVYNSFGVLLNVTDLSALLAADFSLARARDVENGLRFTVFRSQAVDAGLTARYTRSFGPPVTPDRLLGAATLSLRAQRLNADFFAGADGMEQPGTRVALGLTVGARDELFVFEPMNARGVALSGQAALLRLDGGADRTVEYVPSGTIGASYDVTATARAGHTLAAEVAVAAAVGRIRDRSQLITAGGADGVRGYAPGELFARARALGRLEYRHAFVHDLDWNLGHYNRMRGFGGALFLDAAALSPCDGYAPEAAGVYAAAGYGLRFFYDSFGTLQQMMRLDVAVPLVRRERSCLGQAAGEFPPVMVYLGFLPPF